MNNQQVLTGSVFNESSCHPSLFSQLRRLPIGHFKHLTGATTHGVIRRDPRVIDGFEAPKATIQKETTRFLMVFAHEILPVQESPQYRSSSPQMIFRKVTSSPYIYGLKIWDPKPKDLNLWLFVPVRHGKIHPF